MSKEYTNIYRPKGFFWREPGWRRKKPSKQDAFFMSFFLFTTCLFTYQFIESFKVTDAILILSSLFVLSLFICFSLFRWRSISITERVILVMSNENGLSKEALSIDYESIKSFNIANNPSYSAQNPCLEILDNYGHQNHFVLSPKVDRTGLFEFLNARIGVESLPKETPSFNLFKNAYSMIALCIMAFVGIYAVIDYMILDETYAGLPPYWTLLVGFSVAIVVGTFVLRLGRVPTPEAATLAVLLGIVVSLALYPGLLRLNQLTDTRGLQTYNYTYAGDNTLTPVYSTAYEDLPSLYIVNDYGYWESFPKEKLFEIELRKGLLGFYQVNVGPIYDDMRLFYDRRK